MRGTRLVVVVEGGVGQVETVVAGVVLVPAGAFVGSAFRAGAGSGREVGAANRAFGGRGGAHGKKEEN
jgi:hypothetical protein